MRAQASKYIQRFKKICFLLLIIPFLLLMESPAGATAPDNYQWVEHNSGIPQGGDIVGISIDPTNTNTIYTMTKSDGIYKSTDGGANWIKKNNGVNWWEASSKWGYMSGDLLTMDPDNPQILYVAFSGKVFKTVNGAENWVLKNTGLTVSGGNEIAGIAVDPSNSQVLYASTIIDNSTGGVFKSINGGDSWTQIAGNSSGGDIGGYSANDGWPLAIDPSDSQKIYFTALHGENYRSTDSGSNWQAMTINEYASFGSITAALTIHPTGHTIFAGFASDSDPDITGLWKSDDYGVTWAEIENLRGDNYKKVISNIKFAPSDPTQGYLVTTTGNIYKTNDSGSSWSLIASHPDAEWYSMAIDPTNPDILYLGTYGENIYKSTDGGVNVSKISNGINILPFMSFFVQSVSDPSIIYLVVMNKGLYKSTDNGYTWAFVSNLGLNKSTYVFAVDPTDPNIIIAPFDDSDGLVKLFRSSNGGENWTVIPNTTNSWWEAITFSSVNHNIIFASNIGGAASGNVIKSTDNGQTWANVDYFNNKSLASMSGVAIEMSKNDENIVYVAGETAPRKIYKTIDGGSNWTTLTATGLTNSTYMRGLNVNPYDPNMLFVGNGSKMFRSVDGGENFTQVLDVAIEVTGCNNASTVTFDKVTTDIAFMNATGCSFKSTDSGATWIPLDITGLSGTINKVLSSVKSGGEALSLSKSNGSFAVYENAIPKFDQSTFIVLNHNGTSAYHPGDTLDFTFHLSNYGPVQGTNPKVVIVLPESGVSYINNTARLNGALITPDPINGKTIIVDTDNLLYQETSDITFQATIDDNTIGQITIDPLITSDEDTTGTKISDVVINVTALGISSSPDISSIGSETSLTDLPQTGAASGKKNVLLYIFILAGILGVSIFFHFARRKKQFEANDKRF